MEYYGMDATWMGDGGYGTVTGTETGTGDGNGMRKWDMGAMRQQQMVNRLQGSSISDTAATILSGQGFGA